MSNPTVLRRAFSPKRSLRLEPQASEGSGLSRISLTGSRKRTRKQSKLQSPEAAAEVDPQKFYEDWKLYPQDEVRDTPTCSQRCQSLWPCLLHRLTMLKSLHGLTIAKHVAGEAAAANACKLGQRGRPQTTIWYGMQHTAQQQLGVGLALLRRQHGLRWASKCLVACPQTCTCCGAFCEPEVMM